ncbi:MAG: universal stress protein [Bacteroidetes bacterium]|nr:universal stress protein [Bacteroidota bacterium]
MKDKLIIVPYDFTEEADCAVNHAARVVEIHDSRIVLLHIVDKKSQSKLKSDHKSIADLESRLNEIASKASANGTGIAREGDIFTTIPSTAEELGAELIIFGTHGVRGMQHILGAFALKLVTSSKVPVVIVQRRPIRTHGYKKIIYPVDENPYSKQKAYAVADFAKVFGAEVLIFPKKNSDDHFQNYTNGNLRYSEKVFTEAAVHFSVFENTKTGSFSKQVVEFAARNDADLISITTQDSEDRDVGDIFVGSEDVRIINNEAEIPTLCINAVVSLKVGGLAGVTSS